MAQLDLVFRSWGGARKGAGRRRGAGRGNVSHNRRLAHEPRCPAHVTLRVRPGLPSLRDERLFPAVRRALARTSANAFRVLHFSVQADHLHLIIEADRAARFTRGVQGLAIRVAKAVNRVLGRRGSVWCDRFHARDLRTPREVRNALVYVLNNVKKHLRGVRGLDPFSSARWFDGWRDVAVLRFASAPVVHGRTWLVRVGWRRHGAIDVEERPRRPR